MKPAISRRSLLKSAGALASAGFLLEPREANRALPTDQTRPRVLALIGDRYHNADYIRVALSRLFGELSLPIDCTINYDQISARLLRPYRLFVVLRDGMIWPHGYLEPNDYEYSHSLENLANWPKEQSEPWITEEQGAAIKDFVEAGGGLYALHNSSHISLSSRDYREVMGGAYIDHPPLRPFKVSVVNKDHPITRGVQDFMVNDEQHFVTYDKDPQYIFLRSENIDGLTDVYEGKDLGAKAIAGWAYDFGKGRVAFTAVGHTLHAMWQPEYFKLQKNAVTWLLRME
ncbi:MAG: ThuA domain-containing protein [Acidobacteriia bacterium]|nr:ThuA domain-containing protein [Terriglobia bacterium]